MSDPAEIQGRVRVETANPTDQPVAAALAFVAGRHVEMHAQLLARRHQVRRNHRVALIHHRGAPQQ